MSLMLGAGCMYIDPNIIMSAFLITAFMVCCLTVYALITKTDFTGCGPYLCGMLFVLIGIGFLHIFGLFNSSLYGYLGVWSVYVS